MNAGAGADPVRPGECHGIGGEAPDPDALAHLARLAELVAWLDDRVQLPGERLPPPAGSGDPAAIEATAAACRRCWGLAPDLPLPDLTRVVERAGVVVAPTRAPVASVRVGRRHIVALGAGAGSSRFALACLTGHVILHRGLDADAGDRRAWSAEAELFAWALLLPREGLLRELPRTPSLDAAVLGPLARRWKVSLDALVARAAELPVVNAVRYRDLRDHVVASRGPITRGPAEIEEPPEVLSLALRQVQRGLGIRWPEVARRLGWSGPAFRDIVGLDLAEPQGKVVSLAEWKARRFPSTRGEVDARRQENGPDGRHPRAAGGVQLELDFGPSREAGARGPLEEAPLSPCS